MPTAWTCSPLGQYLQPSVSHLPVARFVHPTEFDALAETGRAMGFSHVASGPMVRSSYHADRQAAGVTTAMPASGAPSAAAPADR